MHMDLFVEVLFMIFVNAVAETDLQRFFSVSSREKPALPAILFQHKAAWGVFNINNVTPMVLVCTLPSGLAHTLCCNVSTGVLQLFLHRQYAMLALVHLLPAQLPVFE